MTEAWAWLGAFILLAYTIEAVTGFGSIVIALSLGASFLPIADLLPVLVPLNIVSSGYLSLRHRAHIDWATLLRRILPLMAAGTLAGHLLRPALGGAALQGAFGVLVAWFACRELWRMHRAGGTRRHGPAATRALMLGAGITHGLFASGGPLLVYGLAGTPLEKASLRATLLAVWLSLNCMLSLLYAFDGSLVQALPRLGAYLPLVVIGIVAGEWLHHRIDEHRFRQIVFLLLAFTGVLLVLRG